MTDIGHATRRITLLTDFGTRDGYAAAMRGVIAGIAPDALVEDATHDIPPGDVLAAAWALAMYALTYPPGTIHVAIVDPGVGAGRRAIAVRAGGQIFIGPDNGLFTRVLDEDSEVVEIQEPAFRRSIVSPTFHGRDVFAPAAAHIARGVAIDQLGPRAVGLIKLDLPMPQRVGEKDAAGDVIHVDRFGNLITNIPVSWLPPLDQAHTVEVRIGAHTAAFAKTYGLVGSGELVAYAGSARTLEIGIRDGDAAFVTGTQRGARVTLHHTDAAQSSD
jgi:S-adenosylmethionine hydrolase